MNRKTLGHLERLALFAAVRLAENAHTEAIRGEIAGRTGRRVNRGSLYVTLERLERKGYVRASFGSPSPERGGKAKKFFRIEPAGLEILEVSYNELLAMSKGIDFSGQER